MQQLLQQGHKLLALGWREVFSEARVSSIANSSHYLPCPGANLRVVRIEGDKLYRDKLYLSTTKPISSRGRIVNSYLCWRRAEAN
jgi:hypothetical protein